MSDERTHDVFAATPVNRFLGFVLRSRTALRVEVELPLRNELVQETGVVQGGVLTALADTAAVYLLWPELGPQRTMIGVGCTMNFVSAAAPDGGPLLAVATPVRVGRTIAVCDSEVHQGERLVARGTFTFLLRDRR